MIPNDVTVQRMRVQMFISCSAAKGKTSEISDRVRPYSLYETNVSLYQSTRWHVQCLLYCHKSHEKFMLFNDGLTTYYNLTLV